MRTKITIILGLGILATCCIGAGAQASDKTAPSSPAFGFKGVALGISIDEFRRLPHPDADSSQGNFRANGAEAICTGEQIAMTSDYSREPTGVMVFDETEKSLGVKKCIWVVTDRKFGLAGESAPLSLAGSGYAAYDYSFSFMPDPHDGVLRFFRFEGETNRNAYGDVVEALTTKYGKPKLLHDRVQNGIGNSFDRTTARWDNATSSIVTSDRWGEVDKMGIVVLDKRLADTFEKAKAARKAEAKNPI